MLKEIRISNFQSHAETRLELSPGVNAIVGTSNSGKSAILRAIYWALHNRPLGTSFIRHGHDSCGVAIVTSEHEVARTRSPKLNGYVVDGEVLQALGADVPPQVTDALDIHDINIHKQFDPFYLLMDSPGKVASTINSITHLENAEAVAGALNSKAKAAKQEYTRSIAAADEMDVQLKAYAVLAEITTLFEAAKALEEVVSAEKVEKSQLFELTMKLNAVEQALQKLGDVPDVDLLAEAAVLETEVAERTELRRLTRAIASIDTSLAQLPEVLEVPDATEYALKKGRYDDLVIAVENVLDVDDRLEKVQIELQEAETEYDALLGQVEECPACGQTLDEGSKAQLLKERT